MSGGLRRELGLLSATAVSVGSMIGSGIFFVPNLVAMEYASVPIILGLWALGGLLALAGALTVAELAAMYPRAGGPYDFVHAAFGPAAGFLSGYAYFILSKAAINAAVAVVFGLHVSILIGLTDTGVTLIAIWILAATTFVNWLGVRLAGNFQNGLTFLKAAAILGVVALAFALRPEAPARTTGFTGGGLFSAAFLPILFAYNSWINATFVGEETRDPERNLPRALALSVAIVTFLYVAANIAYLYVLGVDGVASSETVATDVAQTLMPFGGALLAGIVLVSTAGSIHGGLMTGARLPFAMARDGLMPAPLGRTSRFGTPGVALWVQFGFAVTIVLTGTFRQIVSYSVFSVWAVLAVVGLALFQLRRSQPERARPYRVLWYPWIPAAFVGSALFVVVRTLIEQPANALLGIGVTLTGIPLYWWLRARRDPADASPAYEDSA